MAAECLDFYDRRRTLMLEARQRKVEEVFTNSQPCPVAEAEAEVPQIIELTETYLEVDKCGFTEARKNPKNGELESVRVESTTGGYVDRALIAHDCRTAELFDWKFGMWAVEKAENNLQGIAYSLGLFRAYRKLKSITFFFKQPNLQLISSATFARDQIPALYLRVQTVVARAREARQRGDFANANPMVPVCNFCANIGVCPKVCEFACKVGHKFFPLEIPENITPTMVLDRAQSTLAMRLSQVMGIWAKAFRSATTDRVIRGDAQPPEGFRIQTQSKRQVTDSKVYREICLKYLTQAEFDSAMDDPSFGAVEELIKDKAPRGQKKAQVEAFQKELKDRGAVRLGDPISFLKAEAEKE
jgi:hypothetical protein